MMTASVLFNACRGVTPAFSPALHMAGNHKAVGTVFGVLGYTVHVARGVTPCLSRLLLTARQSDVLSHAKRASTHR
ncbi:MAG: hypothetical protein J07HQX50_02774 [Haloquadratum sp. J07HQX50]|nr:MAG: hypothetical protein J07HQX50_02774 [Haloquadratum sp. J07HQX50]